jgi:hypothetical protein
MIHRIVPPAVYQQSTVNTDKTPPKLVAYRRRSTNREPWDKQFELR